MPETLANALPPLPVALPLLAAAALAACRSYLPRRAIDALALCAAVAHFAICLLLASEAQTHAIVYWFGSWTPRGAMAPGIDFVIDPVSAALAALCGFLTILAVLFSWGITDAGGNHMQPLILVFLAGMSGFCLTGDLFNMFVFFELMSTAAFALTGLKTREPAPLQGAFNFAVTNTVAAFFILTGIAFLYAVTGALNMAQIGLLLAHRRDGLVLFAGALLLCGFLTKAAIVPFHLWLPDAHSVSPTSVCVLFSGVMVELGLYAVLRVDAVVLIPALDGKAAGLRMILLSLGGATAILGGLMSYAEHHIKRVLAFSTISHAGLMLIMIALQGPFGTAAFLLYLAGHALIKSGLFFVAGILLYRFGTSSEPVLFGRGKALPGAGVLWFLGALGLAAVPCFATALGDALASRAAGQQHCDWVSYLFIVGGLFTSGAVFRVGFHTFLGWGSCPISDSAAQVDEMPESDERDRRIPWYRMAPPAICLAASLSLAFVPHLSAYALDAGSRLSAQTVYLHAVYAQRSDAAVVSPPSGGSAPVSTDGLIAALTGLVLALSSVFRLRLPRRLRAGAFLEGRLNWLRALQSGHVSDYVTWQTIGAAGVGLAFLVFLQ